MDKPDYVITLVHGTFAKNAEWARPESQFSRWLASGLSSTVEVGSFDWSGLNSHDARRTGAVELVAYLSAKLREFPSSKHCVVAHSHGGNVALYAQADEAICGRLCIVTLGTPFVSCSPRHLDKALKLVAATIVVPIMLIGTFGLAGVFAVILISLSKVFDSKTGQLWSYALSIAFIALVMRFFGTKWEKLVSNIYSKLAEAAERRQRS
jgi:hypothetical protein